MKSIKKDLLRIIIACVLVMGVSFSVAPTAKAAVQYIDGGEIHGPFYQTYSNTTLKSFTCSLNTLCKETKAQVIRRYGSVDTKSSYYVSYYNKIVYVNAWSQRGYVINISLIY